jgi:tetratricopeptide (TPR) repeat protein
VKRGAHEEARQALLGILKEPISAGDKKTALNLLATATLALADRFLDEGKPLPAKQLLSAYLEAYGASDASVPIRNRRDEINLKAGQQFESAKQYENALNAYAAISEDSPSFQQAKKGMRRIWLEFQQKSLRNQNLAQLMERAEKNFLAKQYLTPVNENAYSIYKAVLVMDPGNETALRRIGQMKEFYLEHGEKQLRSGNLNRALTYFERYEIIDPDNTDVDKKIEAIKKQLEAPKAPVTQPPSAKEKEIKSLLEKSGKNGTWIMKYLFEDKQGEKEDQPPWN